MCTKEAAGAVSSKEEADVHLLHALALAKEDVNAQVALGNLYAAGLRVNRDIGIALYWYVCTSVGIEYACALGATLCDCASSYLSNRSDK